MKPYKSLATATLLVRASFVAYEGTSPKGSVRAALLMSRLVGTLDR